MKITYNKAWLFRLGILAMSIFAVVLYLYVQKNVSNMPKINEIGFNTSDDIDWIEIYNPTMNNFSLKGLYLSDSSSNYTKYEITDDVVLPAKSFVVICCKGYKPEDRDNIMITNFRIANGETIYLVAANGTSVIDSLTAVSSDEDATDFSIGLFPDGSDDIYIMSSMTPGTRNQKDGTDTIPIDMEQFGHDGFMMDKFRPENMEGTMPEGFNPTLMPGNNMRPPTDINTFNPAENEQ